MYGNEYKCTEGSINSTCILKGVLIVYGREY